MTDQPELCHHPAEKPLRLRNATCVYCGVEFGPGQKRTREHVIAQKFVPDVDFNRQWNLIVNACKACGNEKSDLEGELAALTMQPDVFGRFAHSDERLAREARRKGRGAVSARTGKPVAESHERFTVKGELMPGVSVSFGFVGPPQSRRDRVVRLAELHVRAFFYLITYDRQTQRGGGPSGAFLPVSIASKLDWGNAVLRALQDTIADWPFRTHALAADGYFKLVIRRKEGADLWAWALSGTGTSASPGSSATRRRFESSPRTSRPSHPRRATARKCLCPSGRTGSSMDLSDRRHRMAPKEKPRDSPPNLS